MDPDFYIIVGIRDTLLEIPDLLLVRSIIADILKLLGIHLKVINVFRCGSVFIKGSCIQLTIPMWYHRINLSGAKIPTLQRIPYFVSTFNTILVITQFLNWVQCMTACHAWNDHVVKLIDSCFFNNITNRCLTVQKVLVRSFIYCRSWLTLPLFIINRLTREVSQQICIHSWWTASWIWRYTLRTGLQYYIRNWRSREVLLDLNHSDYCIQYYPLLQVPLGYV